MEDLLINNRVTIRAAELGERFSRSSGPGGQGVNTADSRVELIFDVAQSPSIPDRLRTRMTSALAARLVDGRLTIVASEHRTQLANRRAARDRLAAMLRDAALPPPPARRATKPTKGSQERRLAAKKRRGEAKRQRTRPMDESG